MGLNDDRADKLSSVALATEIRATIRVVIALHKNLKEGLVELEHDMLKVASWLLGYLILAKAMKK